MNPNGPFGVPFVTQRSVGYEQHVTGSSQRRPLVENRHWLHLNKNPSGKRSSSISVVDCLFISMMEGI